MSIVLAAALAGQGTPDTHVAAAKVAAGATYQNLFNFLCTVPGARGGGPRGGGPRGGGPAPGPPDRSTWHAEPVKVFGNYLTVAEECATARLLRLN